MALPNQTGWIFFPEKPLYCETCRTYFSLSTNKYRVKKNCVENGHQVWQILSAELRVPFTETRAFLRHKRSSETENAPRPAPTPCLEPTIPSPTSDKQPQDEDDATTIPTLSDESSISESESTDDDLGEGDSDPRVQVPDPMAQVTDPRVRDLVSLWIQHNLTDATMKSFLGYLRVHAPDGIWPSFRRLREAKLALPLPTLLPIPEKCGAGYRFSLGNVVSHLVAHFDIRTTPPNPRPAATEPLDEFWKGSRFALKYEEHVKHHVGIFLPLIVDVDDLGVSNGLHSHRPYCAIWVTPAGIPHRIRNTVGWLPLGVLANPTRLAKQTLFQCICQDFVAAQEQATSPQSPFPVLFAVTGDSVALAEICGVVRPGRSVLVSPIVPSLLGRSAHGCLYCETFARNSTSVCPAENSTPRTPAREAELQRRFESASNATSQRLQRDTGYLPTGCPALRFPLGFDPYVSALPDLDHIESGHTTRFILARVLQGPLRSLAIARLEQLRDHLPSHVGALPRLSHAKKLSFTELRLLLQLCGPMLWDSLPAHLFQVVVTQTKYLSLLYNRFSTLSELKLAGELMVHHRRFIESLPLSSHAHLNLHTALCALPSLIPHFGSPALFRSQRNEHLHRNMKRFSGQTAHMDPTMSSKFLLTAAWHTVTITPPAPASPPHVLIGDAIVLPGDFVLVESRQLIEVRGITERTVDGQLWRLTSRVCPCPFPTFARTEECLSVPVAVLREKVMLLPCFGCRSSHMESFYQALLVKVLVMSRVYLNFPLVLCVLPECQVKFW
ncbi:hypothetical protein PAPYR_11996 [Paratrimastix pyriformis]|uniref:Uncharacterized protein n=1 Tax=Paratrimastix pyriformis TaxID=342808 RepID=A0ABQ8U521_9EUKA|nr:hypothetical protein PAPYR_11996 [Paratrimastix pyriformis]